jgi:hypothetical protein
MLYHYKLLDATLKVFGLYSLPLCHFVVHPWTRNIFICANKPVNVGESWCRRGTQPELSADVRSRSFRA